MKKFTGWVLIILCSSLLMIFAMALAFIIIDVINNKTEVQMAPKEMLTSSIGFIIVISLLVLGLMKGLNKIKKEKSINSANYDKIIDIKLSGQIQYKDYRNMVLGATFKRPRFILIFGISLLFILTLLINSINISDHSNTIFFVIIVLVVFMLTPFFSIIQAKKLYKRNKIFQGKLDYHLRNNSIEIKGETVNSVQYWSHFHKIKESTGFFLFYQDDHVATLVNKNMFTATDLNVFRQFIKTIYT